MGIYLLRGTAVALSEFVLLYALLWASVSGSWWLWSRNPKRRQHSSSSNFLLALQLIPFALSAFLVLSLAVPAFLRFEPQRGEEEFGLPIIFFGLLSIALLSVGAWRATRAIRETRRLVRKWDNNAVATEQIAGWPAMSTAADAPPLVVAGLIRPKLYVSSSAAKILSQDELARAIAHESAHVQRYDNLKKFFLRLCCVPSTSALERQWLAAVEIAADMDAVHSRREALDLASALVKASKITAASPDLAMTFTADGTQLLRTRVERLLSWDDSSSKASSYRLVLTISLFAAFAVLTTPWYSTILLAVHQFSEILVR
jgi:Zn-dependent protease with chaperone function